MEFKFIKVYRSDHAQFFYAFVEIDGLTLQVKLHQDYNDWDYGTLYRNFQYLQQMDYNEFIEELGKTLSGIEIPRYLIPY